MVEVEVEINLMKILVSFFHYVVIFETLARKRGRMKNKRT
jgi:hypothetical protein